MYLGIFPGQYYDSETGLHYNWHRYYNPETGRYLRTDPIGFEGGDLNLYNYVRGNPINWGDPWGLTSFWASRPVSNVPFTSHDYIVTHSRFPGDPLAVNNLHSYGRTPDGMLGEVFDGTRERDIEHWLSLNESRDRCITEATFITWNDDLVEAYATTLIPNNTYNPLSNFWGANSNSAARAIVNRTAISDTIVSPGGFRMTVGDDNWDKIIFGYGQ